MQGRIEKPRRKFGRIRSVLVIPGILMLGALLIQCEIISNREDAEAQASGSEFMLNLQILDLLSGARTGYPVLAAPDYTDLGDGTIKREQLYYECGYVNGCPGKRAYPVIYIRKCLHGQVYRAAQNDCRGTGNSGNEYGATQVEFCATDDDSCEDSNGIPTSSSPAHQACASDTTAGRTWSLAIISEDYHPFYVNEPGFPSAYPEELIDMDFMDEAPDLPDSEPIWHGVQDGGTAFYLYGSGFLSGASTFDYSRNSMAYVLCMSMN